MLKFTLNSELQWDEISKEIINALAKPILLLKANMGAGKTTFTKYLLKNLKSRDDITSPTYSIVNEYVAPKGLVSHFDLYRLKNLEEIYAIGIDDYFRKSVLCIIEWPELFENELNETQYHILSITDHAGIREVEFN